MKKIAVGIKSTVLPDKPLDFNRWSKYIHNQVKKLSLNKKVN